MKIDIFDLIILLIIILYFFLDKYLVPLKVNAKLEKIRSDFLAKLEEIKSLYSKEQYIHRLQFEKEFEIYQELWTNLITLKNDARLFTLHDALKTTGESIKEKEGEMIIKLMDDINNAQRTIENNRPFYGEEIHENALKIVELTKAFFGRSKDLDEKEMEYLLKLVKRESEIYEIIDNIEKAIRKRIRNIGEAKLVG